MPDNGLVALVTGARKGIGRFLAEHLLQQGYRVMGCSRNPADWQAKGFTHVEADVSDEQQVKALMREIRQSCGRLDVAINNAGVASMNHMLLTPVSTV
jgi:3-oxoacyl-[acyl-carrier protein] reductase